MSIRIIQRSTTLAVLAACLCALHPAVAAVPEPADGEVAAKTAVSDSSRLLPNWLHLHGAAGLGWLASPEWMRKFYQAGQGYELGLEIRPGPSLRLRLNGEYQTLPAVTNASFTFITATSLDRAPARDTIQVETRTTGWIGSARLEAQMALTPHLWVIGGFGRGYLETGLRSFHEGDEFASVDLQFPGSSGWTWIATAGTSYEFDIFGPRLSAEVRSSYLIRDQDRFQTWSIRLGWGGQ
jgi:hypothetical protein